MPDCKRDVQKIHKAWLEGGTIAHPANAEIQAALVPPGGDWNCTAKPGAITRSIVWRGQEVALVNPRGDLDDATEGHIAMALRAAPVMDRALRVIRVLSHDPENLALIGDIARAAIATIEQPAPPIPEPEEESYISGVD